MLKRLLYKIPTPYTRNKEFYFSALSQGKSYNQNTYDTYNNSQLVKMLDLLEKIPNDATYTDPIEYRRIVIDKKPIQRTLIEKDFKMTLRNFVRFHRKLEPKNEDLINMVKLITNGLFVTFNAKELRDLVEMLNPEIIDIMGYETMQKFLKVYMEDKFFEVKDIRIVME